jgi:hypothetical protein
MTFRHTLILLFSRKNPCSSVVDPIHGVLDVVTDFHASQIPKKIMLTLNEPNFGQVHTPDGNGLPANGSPGLWQGEKAGSDLHDK